ncbi:IclR family transcriptional regulator [Azospirillum sp. ST 5-10]|uniref:IclR family transcriptional regulator n=1 Tax=unclassified Azospirillum TaxID=2630922 RepID=UPI003F4A6871
MIVKQAENLLAILELFARVKRPRTLSQISEALGLPKSSTFNLLETLETQGFIHEMRLWGGYYPTRRLLALAQEIAQDDPFIDRLRPVLTWLQEQTGETVLLAHRADLETVYLEVIESQHPVRYFARTGDRRPIQVTSGGKAILSCYGAEERARLFAAIPFQKYRDCTLPDAAAVEADIQASIRRGWFENLSEFTADVLGIGMPVVLDGERLALSVAGPNFRLMDKRAEVAARIAEAIEKIRTAFTAHGDAR